MLVDERRIAHWRLIILGGLWAVALGVLIYRLYELQVARGQEYVKRLRTQTTVAVRLSPARGLVVDRAGVALAENRASYDIDLYLDQLQRTYARNHKGRVPRLRVYNKRRQVWETTVDIGRIVHESLKPIVESLGLKQLPDPKDLQEHFRIRRNIPYAMQADVNFATLAQFSERNLGIPGVEIVARPVRHYPYGALAAHVLGYIGRPDEAREAISEEGYEYDTIGRVGIEGVRDAHLQGKPGGKILRVDNRGYIDREEGYEAPTLGKTIHLTLDAKIQYVAEQAMRGVGRGAAVVVDCNSGDILALVAVPSFDPNRFVPQIPPSEWRALNQDASKPLLNRALQAYAPGSTFKVPVALAALKAKAITPRTYLNCPPAIAIGNRYFKDHNTSGFGSISLHTALEKSSNVFFYQAGIKAGAQAIDALCEIAGLGERTGIEIGPEASGILPGPEWMAQHRKRERWTTAHTANLSIGQGFLTVTPLQMTMLMAAVANGGTVYFPRLTQEVTDADGRAFINVPEKRVRGNLDVNPADLKAVQAALRAVVESGTGRRVAQPDVVVAGKTGSAQFSTRIGGRIVKDTRAWFYGFAPYENPRYAFCVLVEGGVAGGVTAGPIASTIVKGIFAVEKGEPIELRYLAPAVGHFRGVDEIAAAEAAGALGVPDAAGRPGADGGVTADAVPGAEPDIVQEDEPSAIMPKRRF